MGRVPGLEDPFLLGEPASGTRPAQRRDHRPPGMHAVTTRDASGAGRESCVGCHTSNGFIGRIKGAQAVDTTFGAINCQTCHEPHGQTTPTTAAHLVRSVAANSPMTLSPVNGADLILIGSNATLLNGCTIGEGALIAAGSVVGERAQIPDRVVAAGAPAKVKKTLEGEAAQWIEISAKEYVKLSRSYLANSIGAVEDQEVRL